MTIQDYFESLVGQFLEVAGTDARNQCVDSVNFYIKFVLRRPVIEHTNARDFPERVDKDHYDWIENTDTNSPLEGDIVIWGGNIYGHTGVCFGNDADSKKFRSFDQNYPLYSACRVIEHTYYNVRGWLRPKGITTTKPTVELTIERRDELEYKETTYNMGRGILDISDSRDAFLAELKKLKELNAKLEEKDAALKKANELIDQLELKLKQIQESHTQNVQDVQKVEEVKVHVDEQGKAINEVVDDIQEIKDIIKSPEVTGFVKWLRTKLDKIIHFFSWEVN